MKAKTAIESATVYFPGERAAGIRPATFRLTMFIDPLCFTDEDWPGVVEDARTKIVDLYDHLHDDGVPQVTFDYEETP